MPNKSKKKKSDVGPGLTPGLAEGSRESVDEALDRAAEASIKQGHRTDLGSPPVAGAGEGKSVRDAKAGKKSQAA